jgi:hypothetical protein
MIQTTTMIIELLRGLITPFLVVICKKFQHCSCEAKCQIIPHATKSKWIATVEVRHNISRRKLEGRSYTKRSPSGPSFVSHELLLRRTRI